MPYLPQFLGLVQPPDKELRYCEVATCLCFGDMKVGGHILCGHHLPGSVSELNDKKLVTQKEKIQWIKDNVGKFKIDVMDKEGYAQEDINAGLKFKSNYLLINGNPG